jgi:pimeloyl-ACP methyl ester carboxylesterase
MRARCRDIEAAWFEVGRGSPIILVHGLADDHRLWRLMLPDLCLRHRVVLVDVRGHGQSTAGRGAGTLRQLGDDLVALMDAIGLERAAIAGYSLGGTVAMRLAIDHPERVDVIFPIATSSRVGRSVVGWYTERADKPEDELRRLIDRDTVEQYQLAPGELEAALRMRREATADLTGYRNGCRAMARLHQEPLDAELVQIKAPTLVISADLDQHCPPRAGEIITDAVPGASMEVVAGSAHPIPIQKPEVLVTLIENFLREAAAA